MQASTVELTTANLRQKIRVGDFTPGQRLIEADLREELGVSRSSIREAFRRLAAEGLVDIQHHKGARVRLMTRKEVLAQYDLREMLEGLAARRAAQNYKSSLLAGDLDTAIASLRQAVENVDVGRFFGANQELHRLLIAIADNPLLDPIISQLSIPMMRIQFRSLIDRRRMEESQADHHKIARAVKSGRAADAEKYMRAHINNSREMIQKLDDAAFRRETD